MKRETASLLAFIDVEENVSLEQLEENGSAKYLQFLEGRKQTELAIYEPKREIKLEKILQNDKVLQQVEKEFAELNETAKKENKTHHILSSQRGGGNS